MTQLGFTHSWKGRGRTQVLLQIFSSSHLTPCVNKVSQDNRMSSPSGPTEVPGNQEAGNPAAKCSCANATSQRKSQDTKPCSQPNCCCSHGSTSTESTGMDAAKSASSGDGKSPAKHGAMHYCSSCPPGPHMHHMYAAANCHPQQVPYVDHGHCGCSPGLIDGHYHYHPQQGPRPVAIMGHPPPPLLLRPIHPQHMQQHQVCWETHVYKRLLVSAKLLVSWMSE